MSFSRVFLLSVLSMSGLLVRAGQVVRLFPSDSDDIAAVKRAMPVRGRGTQSLQKETVGGTENTFIRLAAAPGTKMVQMMTNLRPNRSVGGVKTFFSAQVRGTGEFDVVAVSQLNGSTGGAVSAAKMKLTAQWKPVTAVLDFKDKIPDQILLWVRAFGENSCLDIRDIRFELRCDENVSMEVPDSCLVVPAAKPLPELNLPVKGKVDSVNVVRIGPDGKRKNFTVKNIGGKVTIPHVQAQPGVYHFAVGAAGCSFPFKMFALPERDYAAYCQAAGKLKFDRPLNILVLGDSLSDFRRGNNWTDLLQTMLKARRKESRIFNYACRGDTVNHVLKRLQGRRDVFSSDHYAGIQDYQYDLVLVFLGQNDTVARRNSNFTKPQIEIGKEEEYYRQMLSALKNVTQAPVVIFSAVSTPQEVCAANAARYGYRFGVPALVENYNRLVLRICEENQYTYWDIYTPLNRLENKGAYFQKDGVHFNDRGNFFAGLFAAGKLAELPASVWKRSAEQPQWRVDHPAKGLWILRNESSVWKGINAKGVVSQAGPELVVRKVFDLTKLPQEALDQADTVYLRMFLGILDYSICKPGKPNGLTEKLFIRINGETFVYSTGDPRFPTTSDSRKKRRQEWCDIPIPAKFIRNCDRLTVEFGKVMRGDDYLYPGFDGDRPASASFVSYNAGKTWSRIWQKAPLGELMMRLVIAAPRKEFSAVYLPENGKKDDPGKALIYVENRPEVIRMELNTPAMDFSRPVKVEIDYQGEAAPELAMMFSTGEGEVKQQTQVLPGKVRCDISRKGEPYGISIDRKNSRIGKVSITYSPALEIAKPVNMAPKISRPAGKRIPGTSGVKLADGRATLSTPALEMVFNVKGNLALERIIARDIGRQIIRFPGQSAIFKIKKDGRIYSAADASDVKAEKTADGIRIAFRLPAAGADGVLTLRIQENDICWQLCLTCGPKAGNFIVAFPHVDGLVLSDDPDHDYYCFPSFSGIIADCNTVLRAVYGANNAWWQMVDLFSPALGGGFAMRIDDSAGIYKAFNLRKGSEAAFQHKKLYPHRPGKHNENIMFPACLELRNGIGLAVDYQRRKLAAGEKLTLPAAVFSSHPGSWKTPMKEYAAWAHKVWKFRPHNGRIQKLWNLHAGWGIGSPLWKDGKYHERYVSPNTSFLELICYWTVSSLGPWDTPIDRLETLGPRAVRSRAGHFGYWVDPATGKEVYAYNRGDYDGYNPQWGGLPALRAHIEKLHRYGKTVIFYTDPIIVCPNTKLGKSKGIPWGVINPDWKDPFSCRKNPKDLLAQGYAFHYYSYCMCLNNPEYIKWVAENMARLIRETGIDGIRLDEFGHGGYICLSRKHRHLFPGDGENVWLRAIKCTVEAIRKETDKFNKDVILMGEYQGTDFTSAAFDGALCYDIRQNTSQLRPIGVNLFRFYFPECKLFELDETNKNSLKDVWLFNAMGVYNSSLYPPAYHDVLKKYTPAFNGKIEPLVDTLAEYVYANRFEAPDGSVVVHTLFNRTGHTVDAPVLEVNPAGTRFFDAFTGRELTPVKLKNGKYGIRVKIGRDKVFVLAEHRK